MFPPRSQPLFYLGKFRIGVTELIILLELVGVLLVAFTQGRVPLGFSASAIFQGEVWRLMTYPLMNEVGVLYLLGLYFLYTFGRAVEAELGRRSYLTLCGGVILAVPLVFLPLHLAGLPSARLYAGSQLLHLCILIAYCVMYPHVRTALLHIPLKWLGLTFFLISIVASVRIADWAGVMAALLAVLMTLVLVQSSGRAGIRLLPDALLVPQRDQTTSKRRRAAKHKRGKGTAAGIKPKLAPRTKVPLSEPPSEVDTILDKISEHGLHSLTDAERKTLMEDSSKKRS